MRQYRDHNSGLSSRGNPRGRDQHGLRWLWEKGLRAGGWQGLGMGCECPGLKQEAAFAQILSPKPGAFLTKRGNYSRQPGKP